MGDSYLEFLRKTAESKGIRIPTRRTLLKYGLTERAWLIIFHQQDWKCPICLIPQAHWNVDHEHMIGWAKMTPKEKAKYVRGILCWRCNKNNAPSNLSAQDAQRLADYIANYESRRDKNWVLKHWE